MFCSGYFTKLEASLFIFMLTMSLTDLTYALCFIEKKTHVIMFGILHVLFYKNSVFVVSDKVEVWFYHLQTTKPGSPRLVANKQIEGDLRKFLNLCPIPIALCCKKICSNQTSSALRKQLYCWKLIRIQAL